MTDTSAMDTEQRLRYLLRRVSTDLEQSERQRREQEAAAREPIAVVGLGCRLPGDVGDPEGFWRLLDAGAEGLTDIPSDRGWDLSALHHPEPGRSGTFYARRGGFLRGADLFDAEFFDIAPREAVAMDPQQRILLETTWEALEHAGMDPVTLRGSRVGVYVGTNGQDYPRQLYGTAHAWEGYLGTGNAASVLSGRVSYALGLDGPSITVDTACSSSLVTLYLAAQALRRGECDRALAGGVTVMTGPDLLVEFSKQQGLSRDGRCRAFGRGADGTGLAEGAGMLVLERLSDARRLGHPVLALVTGSAVNSDGASNGLAAPSGPAQERVIRAALDRAGIGPADVDVVEAHGTGTVIGDPIEAEALSAVYGRDRPADRPLYLGAVKSNIGHTQAAAGVAGVIKMILALAHQRMPATLHAERPTEHVDWSGAGVELLSAARTWDRGERVRRAGVSGFGISGTNAHVIIEESPAEEPAFESAPDPELPTAIRGLVTLSARTPAALRDQADRLGAFLNDLETVPSAEQLAAATSTRSAMTFRAALPVSSVDGTRPALEALAADRHVSGAVTGRANTGGKLALLFPGQGSQRPGAGGALYRSEPVFARALEGVLAQLDPHLDRPLLPLLLASPDDPDAALLHRTRYAQPALFAIGVATSRLLSAAGLVPDLLIGHSIGELTAAHLAGVLDLRDAARLVAARGALMDDLASGGAMAAVEAGEAQVRSVIAEVADEYGVLDLAAVNGPSACVVSGDEDAVRVAVERFRATGGRTRQLKVSHAFHSARLEPMLAAFGEIAGQLEYHEATIPFVSNVTGEIIRRGETVDAGHWVRHARQPVRFADGIRALRAAGAATFIEAGPGGVLSAAVAEIIPEPEILAIPVLPADRDENHSLATVFAHAWVRGLPVRRAAGRVRPGLDLPTYPFQRQRFWPSPAPADPASWRYRVEWEPIELKPSAGLGSWLLVQDRPGESANWEKHFAAAGAQVTTMTVESVQRHLSQAGPADDCTVLFLPTEGDPVPSVLILLQSLSNLDDRSRLWVLTRGAVALDDDGRVEGASADPQQAALWGLALTAALEFPGRWGGVIDLPFGAGTDADVAAVVGGSNGEDQVAVRAQGVFARRVVPAETPNGFPAWEPRGTVVITGGTGGLGAQLAERLAVLGAEHLVLLSRRGATAPGADDLLARLSAAGTSVEAIGVDVGDRAALMSVLRGLDDAAAEGRIPAVQAVVHAAGLSGEVALGDLSAAELAEVGRAKTGAGLTLDEYYGDRPLTAFVLFSSIAATWGSGRLGAYAAANAALDALAARRRSQGRAATSVAWGPWAGAGMAAGAPAHHLTRHGLRLMDPQAALTALLDAVRTQDTHVAIADVDWPRFRVAFESARPARLLRRLPGARTEAAEVGPEAPEPVSPWSTRPSRERSNAVLDLVREEVAAVLEHDDPQAVDIDRPFRELGFDSLTVVELRTRLARVTGLSLPATVVFDHPDARSLAGHLDGLLTPERSAGPTPQSRADALDPAADPLVIVGMACRFPGGVDSPEDLWEVVGDRRDAVSVAPADRGWPGAPRPGGFLERAGDFDADLFGISQGEALAMDPQQRLLLETAWEALERAGIDPSALRGQSGGVYVGAAAQGYGTNADADDEVDGHLISGTVTSVASGRIAYTLGLEGPAVTIDTACSSALVALHLAGQAIRAGECDFALVGGVAVMPTPDVFIEFGHQGANSGDGRCRAYSADADGTGWGEGAGLVVVEKRSRATELGHRELAVIRGSAINSDGASNGLTAPNGQAQQRVIRAALTAAGLGPADVDLVEGHGTGTRLGDPIEVEALLATYGADRPDGQPVWLGSVKSNIGHTQAAAGIAGVIKTVQALREGSMPATLHAAVPSTQVDWSTGTVRLLTEARTWPSDRTRRAGVSAFGMSGTNAHVVLEQPGAVVPYQPGPVGDEETLIAWPLSARSPGALRVQARNLLRARPEEARAVARTLAGRRAAFDHRAVVLGRSQAELADGLAALESGAPSPNLVTGRRRDGRTVFVFPGQGSQWVGMGAALLPHSAVFAAAVQECEQALAPHVDWSLTEVLSGDPARMERVDVVQPALFAVMVALAAVWREAGVEPDLVVGHSQGEIAAAHVAGALSLPDAALVVARRSLALRRLSGRGGMVSVAASEQRARELIAGFSGRIDLAAVNGAGAVVLAGQPSALAELIERCERTGIRAKQIPVDYAAHSAQVEELAGELAAALAPIRPRPGSVPMVSTVTGERIDGSALGPGYWYRNLRETVVFGPVTAGLLETGYRRFVEVSPHPVLVPAVEGTASSIDRPVSVVATLRRRDGGPDRMLLSLAEAWTQGVPVDRSALARPVPEQPWADLPTYPFEHQRFWLTSTGRHGVARAAERLPVPAYRVGWELAQMPEPAASGRDWLIAGPDGPDTDEAQGLLAALNRSGARGRAVAFDRADPRSFAQVLDHVTPAGVLVLGAGAADVVALLHGLDAAGLVIPLWLITAGGVAVDPDDPAPGAEAAALWGLGPVLGLEKPGAWGGLVDIPSPVPDEKIWDQVVSVLPAGSPTVSGGAGATGSTLTAADIARAAEDQIAVRADGVRVRRLQEFNPPLGNVLPGSGPVLLLVEPGTGPELVRSLTGRLGSAGADVLTRTIDLARPEQALDELAGVAGALTAIVHCAAEPGPQAPLTDLSTAEMEQHLEAVSAVAGAIAEVAHRTGAQTVAGLYPPDGTLGTARRAAAAAGFALLAAQLRAAVGKGRVTIVEAPGPDARPEDAAEAVSADVVVTALAAAPDPGVLLAALRWDRLTLTATDPRQLRSLSGLPQLASATDAPADDGLAARLRPLSGAERHRLLLQVVRDQAAAVLGHTGPGSVDAERAFSDMGFDSILAVQFRNALGAAAGVTLPATVVFDYPSPQLLTDLLMDLLEVGSVPAAVPEPEAEPVPAADIPAVLAEIDRLERMLSGLRPGPGEDPVTGRLTALAEHWGDRTPAEPSGPEADPGARAADDLAAASAEELFTLIDTDFGRA